MSIWGPTSYELQAGGLGPEGHPGLRPAPAELFRLIWAENGGIVERADNLGIYGRNESKKWTSNLSSGSLQTSEKQAYNLNILLITVNYSKLLKSMKNSELFRKLQ